MGFLKLLLYLYEPAVSLSPERDWKVLARSTKKEKGEKDAGSIND